MKFGDWINRKRHNRGFGIQSPSAFFFITQVLKERLSYYSYPQLENIAQATKEISPNLAKELFRITNYLQPQNCISINSVTAACAMAAARPSVRHTAITAKENISPERVEILSDNNCTTADSSELLKTLDEAGTIGMLYLGPCDNHNEIFNAALPHLDDKSVIVVENISHNKAARKWWQQIYPDKATVITFDMYSYGLLFFDKSRYKQHYILKR